MSKGMTPDPGKITDGGGCEFRAKIGRTTRMVKTAIEASHTKKVHIFCADRQHCRDIEKRLEWASHQGFIGSKIRVMPLPRNFDWHIMAPRGWSTGEEYLYLVDHWVIERYFSKMLKALQL